MLSAACDMPVLSVHTALSCGGFGLRVSGVGFRVCIPDAVTTLVVVTRIVTGGSASARPSTFDPLLAEPHPLLICLHVCVFVCVFV